MKKFIVGVVVGAFLASAIPAYSAVTTLIGMKVAGQTIVNLNGEEIGTAIIVNNKSYLPVRDTAEAFGVTVTPSSGVISLETSIKKDDIVSELNTLNTDKSYFEKKITELEKVIQYQEEEAIPKAKEKSELYDTQAIRTDSEKQYAHARVTELEQLLAEGKQKLADYKSRLEQINARIAELESLQ